MEKITDFIKKNWDATLRFNTEDDGDLIGLPKPYTVPSISGKFQELYYWDTYFTNVGLIISGKVEQAKNNTENIAYLIERFGFMPNSNRTGHLYNSQPPFFTRMVREVYEITRDKQWLEKMYHAAVKEHEFWQRDRMTPCGLNRYYGFLKDEHVEARAAGVSKRFNMACPEDAQSKLELAWAYITFCESGWDCNSRFGMRPQDYVWAELNCLLYGVEMDLAYFADELSVENDWENQAELRKELMNRICWNDKNGMFADYNFVEKRQSDFVSDAAFYALLTGLCTKEQAQRTVKLLERLENDYGVAACEKRDGLYDLQWDFPHGWACLHFIIIEGLLLYGYIEDAQRIAEKYCRLVETNYEETGTLWEKYNTLTGKVSITKENGLAATMMGWSAGVYLYALIKSKGE